MKQGLGWARNMKLSKPTTRYYGAYSLVQKVDISQIFTQMKRYSKLECMGKSSALGRDERLWHDLVTQGGFSEEVTIKQGFEIGWKLTRCEAEGQSG